ncbi:MAG TPA: outer membrane beta-barrel family protein [Chitinophagaceae bacterium]
MNRICTLIVFVLGCMALQPASAAAAQYRISGSVTDSADARLAYATVMLYRQGQMEQPVKSTFTNEKGIFDLPADTGAYTLVVIHTGFAEAKQDLKLLDGDLRLGTIRLTPSRAKLEEVVVTSRKPLIEQSADKIVYNVESDPASKTETALDILRKTPFVTVDGEDNIQVNGQSNFKVLLNGKETAMFAQNVKEALKGFAGALIVKIEVITSPGAKYDGEGIGGIINIITRKKLKGYSGSISTYTMSNGFSNLNTNLSAKIGRFGFTAHYGGGGNFNLKGTTSAVTTPTVPSAFTRRQIDGRRKMSNFWNFGNAELSIELDSLNTVSIYGNVSGGWNELDFDQSILTTFHSAPASTSAFRMKMRNEFPTTSLGADYIRKFKTPEKEFSLRLNTEFGNANQLSNSFQDNPSSDRFIVNRSIAENLQYTVQADYTLPFKKNRKLETGLKGILRRASSDFRSHIKYDAGEDFKVNPANSDYFSYQQDVYSAYASYSWKMGNTTFRAGGRAEHTVVNGDFSSSSTRVKQEYTTFLPNLQASFKLSGTTTMVMNYNKRLQRPYIWNLNPFVNNNDSLFISYGNPQLAPQTIHTVSAQGRMNSGGNFLSLMLSASYSGDMIVQYARFNPSTGVTATTSENLGKELQFSLNVNATLKLTPKWKLFMNGNLRRSRVKNQALPEQVNSGFGGNANMNTQYSINKRFNLSGYGGFWQAPVSIQFRYPLNIWYGVNVGYKMFSEKLNVSLGAAAFLQKERSFTTVIKDPNFSSVSSNRFPFRSVAVSVSWNFGKLTENVSKKKGVSNDDLVGGGGNSR